MPSTQELPHQRRDGVGKVCTDEGIAGTTRRSRPRRLSSALLLLRLLLVLVLLLTACSPLISPLRSSRSSRMRGGGGGGAGGQCPEARCGQSQVPGQHPPLTCLQHCGQIMRHQVLTLPMGGRTWVPVFVSDYIRSGVRGRK